MRNPIQPIQISKQTARRFILDHHFLLPPKQLTQEEILSKLFARLGSIQFDTISVAGRNADLVLQSRVDGYKPEILGKMLYQDRTLLDGWDKMAAIYPTGDWPYFKHHRDRMASYHQTRSKEALKASPVVLEALQHKGPMSSIDFKDDSKVDWWWAPTSLSRAALELLYGMGKVGIHHRVNTRRYFDLIERLLPAAIRKQEPPHRTGDDFLDWRLLRRIGSLGLSAVGSGDHWLAIHEGKTIKQRAKAFKRLLESQKIIEVIVGEELLCFIRAAEKDLLEKAAEAKPESDSVAFIAPLDNLLWNRKLIAAVFGFTYTWEVYKPKSAREYGYYVLPVLFKDQFIARTDLKYDRRSGALQILGWWWEDGIRPDDEIEDAMVTGLKAFLDFLGASSIDLLSGRLTKENTALFNAVARRMS